MPMTRPAFCDMSPDMTRFSANLGFLWTELPLPRAVHAAARAGFAAVECHWPYDTPAPDLRQALSDTGLPMLGINTSRGDRPGDFGLSALPDRQSEARQAIDQAITYARAIGARNIHVMAGKAQGDAARDTFADNILYTLDRTDGDNITILIEPLNPTDAPGYFLSTLPQAQSLLDLIDHPRLKLMFDCYHVAKTHGDPLPWLKTLLPRIGHIQFAGVPDRGAPDRGTLDYRALFQAIQSLGYDRPLGAEYIPNGPTEDDLHWLTDLTAAQP
jgi:hydroxypyruvate isomerase